MLIFLILWCGLGVLFREILLEEYSSLQEYDKIFELLKHKQSKLVFALGWPVVLYFLIAYSVLKILFLLGDSMNPLKAILLDLRDYFIVQSAVVATYFVILFLPSRAMMPDHPYALAFVLAFFAGLLNEVKNAR